MKTITEYLVNNHIKNKCLTISEPIASFVNKNSANDEKEANTKFVDNLSVEDILYGDNEKLTFYCSANDVYLHIRTTKMPNWNLIAALFTKTDKYPNDREFSSFAAAEYRFIFKGKTNHIANFWQMLWYAICNSPIKMI